MCPLTGSNITWTGYQDMYIMHTYHVGYKLSLNQFAKNHII